ncbi:DUF2339 domain-containing protein [Actinomyces sp. B33]|uniref:DUF2339 domain-containing protein n=1 Tax=Actinomyces sp. B33 TaxID=2942131 RepID=UPI002340C41C|nr:DUF2339 domain-containing protein [Actinomyces sp. B33]MDC4232251.1 DUF2339 domain-containing protein [Actinomyces sp. B33]
MGGASAFSQHPARPFAAPAAAESTGRAPGAPIVPSSPAFRPAPPATSPASAPVDAGARESRAGVFILSGLAALLVVLAGASLIALLWDRIPDITKIGIVGVVALASVVGGTFWARRGGRPSIPAATLTGIGTALGYVAGIGTAILGVLAPIGAFVVLLVWSIAMTLVASRERMPFTLVATAVGGIATLTMIDRHSFDHPEQALLALALTTAYSAAILASAAFCAFTAAAGRSRLALLASSMAVTAPATFLTNLREAWETSAPVASVLHGVLLVFAIGSILLTIREDRGLMWNWAWIGAGLLVVISFLQVGSVVRGSASAELWVVLAHLLFLVLSLIVAGSRRLAGPGLGVAEPALVVAALIIGAVSGVEPPRSAWVILGVWTVLVGAGWSLTRRGSWLPLPILPGLGFASVMIGHSTRLEGVVLLLVMVTAIAGTVWADTRLSCPRWAGMTASWLTAATASFSVPWMLSLLVDDGAWFRQSPSAALCAVLGLTVFSGLVLLGLSSPRIRPADLWLARARLGRTGVDDVMGTSERTGLFPPFLVLGVGFVLMHVLPEVFDELVHGSFVAGGHGAGGVLVVASEFLLALALVGTAAVLAWAVGPVSWARAHGVLVVVVGAEAARLACHAVTGVAELGWPQTLAVLLVGAIAIWGGFAWRASAVRLTGLALVILTVLKLAVIDLGFNDSISRIVALFVAGMICFALSVLYSRMSARARAEDGTGDRSFSALSAGADPALGRSDEAVDRSSWRPPTV